MLHVIAIENPLEGNVLKVHLVQGNCTACANFCIVIFSDISVSVE